MQQQEQQQQQPEQVQEQQEQQQLQPEQQQQQQPEQPQQQLEPVANEQARRLQLRPLTAPILTDIIRRENILRGMRARAARKWGKGEILAKFFRFLK